MMRNKNDKMMKNKNINKQKIINKLIKICK